MTSLCLTSLAFSRDTSPMAGTDAQVVGARIAKRRQQLGWSQVELARRLDVSPSTVANWERGAAYPKKKLGKVEQVLGITFNGGDEEREDPGDLAIYRTVLKLRGTDDADAVLAFLRSRRGGSAS